MCLIFVNAFSISICEIDVDNKEKIYVPEVLAFYKATRLIALGTFPCASQISANNIFFKCNFGRALPSAGTYYRLHKKIQVKHAVEYFYILDILNKRFIFNHYSFGTQFYIQAIFKKKVTLKA